MKRVKGIDRRSLLEPRRNSSQEHRIPFVVKYHHSVVKIPGILRKNWHFLSEDEEVGTRFGVSPVTAYRRGKNLKELLVFKDSSDLPGPPGTFTCQRPRCLTCAFVLHQPTVVGPKSTFRIRDSYTCTSSNVVYCILCIRCSMMYIGETKRRLADRFREHLRNARIRNESSEVGVHFSTCHHSTEDMRVTVLKQFKSDIARKNFERFAIDSLGTLDPYGINRM